MFLFCLCNPASVTVTYAFILNFHFLVEMLTYYAIQLFSNEVLKQEIATMFLVETKTKKRKE